MIPQDIYIKELAKVCQHGKNVKNPYTSEMMYVPCGTCPTCLLKKSSTRTIRCQSQQSLSVYTYFVTLTYSTAYVPKARIFHEGGNLFTFSAQPRSKIYKNKKEVKGLDHSICFKNSFKAKPELIHDYIKQANLSANGKYPWLSNTVSYLNRRDLQLFMKRLRYNINKITGKYEKVHFYAVGEYTPKRFRPHFHLLLCFDSRELAENFGQILCSSWQYGRVDFSVARENAASYVAAYVNSSSRLPYFLGEIVETRPFSRFSNGFATDVFAPARGAIQDREPRKTFDIFVDGFPTIVNGDLLLVRPWRSLVDSFFFYNSRNQRLSCRSNLHFILTVCSIARKEEKRTGKRFNSMSYARQLYSHLFIDLDYYQRQCYFNTGVDANTNVLLYYARVENTHFVTEDHKESVIGSLYRVLHGVLKFLDGYDINYNAPDQAYLLYLLEVSKEFYSYRDYAYLKRSLEFIEASERDILDMYLSPMEDSVRSAFDPEKNSVVLDVNLYLNDRVNKSVKHREINDLNLKFVTYD